MPRKSNKNNKYSKELIESILKEHFENHYSSYCNRAGDVVSGAIYVSDGKI